MQIQPRVMPQTYVPTLLSSVSAGMPEAPGPRRAPTPAAKSLGDVLVATLRRLLLKPQAPVEAPAAEPSWIGDRLHARRADWFISQYKSNFNPQEDVAKNANCGPACVTMIAKAFGKVQPGAAQADTAIEQTRQRMGESLNEKEWTSADGLVKSAKSYGLTAYNTVCKSLDGFKAELAKGRLLIANVMPKYMDEANNGGHFTVVTAIKDGKVYLNDPISRKGPVVVSEQEFMRAVQLQKTHAVTSIGA